MMITIQCNIRPHSITETIYTGQIIEKVIGMIIFMQIKPNYYIQNFRIAQLALVNCLIEILWFYGITFCGPLR